MVPPQDLRLRALQSGTKNNRSFSGVLRQPRGVVPQKVLPNGKRRRVAHPCDRSELGSCLATLLRNYPRGCQPLLEETGKTPRAVKAWDGFL